MTSRGLVSAIGLAFVVSVSAHLLGIIGLAVSAVTSPFETISAVLRFWSPVFVTWFVLTVVFAVVFRLRPSSSSATPETRSLPCFAELETVEYPGARTEALERLLDRAQSVLDEQLTVLADTDDKAVRTVRVEVLLLGGVASAGQITPDTVPVNVWIKVGGALVVGSIVAGVLTYSSSTPDFGPSPESVHSEVETDSGRTDIYLELLGGTRKRFRTTGSRYTTVADTSSSRKHYSSQVSSSGASVYSSPFDTNRTNN